MSTTAELQTLETVNALENRLRKIEYVVVGDKHLRERDDRRRDADSTVPTITERLYRLERELERLRKRSKVVQDILDMRKDHNASACSYY